MDDLSPVDRNEILVLVDNKTGASGLIAADMLAKGMTLGDHDRFAEAFLGQLRTRGSIGGARKGGLS